MENVLIEFVSRNVVELTTCQIIFNQRRALKSSQAARIKCIIDLTVSIYATLIRSRAPSTLPPR